MGSDTAGKCRRPAMMEIARRRMTTNSMLATKRVGGGANGEGGSYIDGVCIDGDPIAYYED